MASLGPPIRAFVGGNGSGKTLGAVALCAGPALRAGIPVYATFHIDHPNAFVLRSWDITDLRDCVLILDEISAQFPSRGAMGLPHELVSTLQQLRKPNVQVVWTAPAWGRADVVLREVTQVVTVCRAFIPDRFVREQVIPPWWRPFPRALHSRGGSSAWVPRSLFRYVSYDAANFDEFSLGAVKDVRPLEKRWYWRPWHADQWVYDTAESVPTLPGVTGGGVCLVCGGQRVRQRCTCSGRVEAAALPPLGGSEGVP